MEKYERISLRKYPNCVALSVAEQLSQIIHNLPELNKGDVVEVKIAGIPETCQGRCMVMKKMLEVFKQQGLVVRFGNWEEFEQEMRDHVTAQMEREAIEQMLSEIGIVAHGPLGNDKPVRNREQSFEEFLRKKLMN